jgi:hypothetical protein
MLILRITSMFSNAEGSDLSFRVCACSKKRLSSSFKISEHPWMLSQRARPASGAFFCAPSTISHTACAVRNFGLENSKKGKITCEKASSTTSCETAGNRCKTRKDRCMRRIAREAWTGFEATASETALTNVDGSDSKRGRRTAGSEYSALRTVTEGSCTRARNAERKDS